MQNPIKIKKEHHGDRLLNGEFCVKRFSRSGAILGLNQLRSPIALSPHKRMLLVMPGQ
jgi:hypothetical protein